MELAWLAMTEGNVDEAKARIDTAMQVPVDSQDDPDSAADTGIVHTDLLLKLGALDDLVAVGLSALDNAERAGLSGSRRIIIVRSNVGQTLIELGDVPRAAALIDQATAGTPTRDSRMLHWMRADLDMRRGRLTAAAAFWGSHPDLVWSAANLDNRLEPALRHVELNPWCDDPATAFIEASKILQELCPTDYSRR